MKIRIGDNYTTSLALYNGFKNIFTIHGGWTLSLDTFTSSTDWLLEYTSNVTIDGESIKIRINQTTATTILFGVYDSSNALQTQSITITTISRLYRCGILVADDFICFNQYSPSHDSTNNHCCIGNLVDTENSLFTGADNLVCVYSFGPRTSPYTYVQGGWVNKTYTAYGVTTSKAAIGNDSFNVLMGGSYRREIYSIGTPSNFFKQNKETYLFPVLTSNYLEFGIRGFLKKGYFFQTGATSPGVNEPYYGGETAILNGKNFRRIGIQFPLVPTGTSETLQWFSPNYFSNLVIRWENLDI